MISTILVRIDKFVLNLKEGNLFGFLVIIGCWVD